MGIRCFIAVELPDAVKRGISQSVEVLKKSGADVSWVKEDNIHITLKFLGDTDEELIPSIREALQKKMSPCEPFYITISGAGCFPGMKRPRVLWVGIEDVSGLKKVRNDVEEVMSRFEFEPEMRDFSPHITIGRVRSQRKTAELAARLGELGSLSFDKLQVNRISLMKSVLKPAGAEYSTLAEIPFGRRSDVE